MGGGSNLNNFMYKDDGVVAWRAYNIGEGKTMLWSQLKGKGNSDFTSAHSLKA